MGGWGFGVLKIMVKVQLIGCEVFRYVCNFIFVITNSGKDVTMPFAGQVLQY